MVGPSPAHPRTRLHWLADYLARAINLIPDLSPQRRLAFGVRYRANHIPCWPQRPRIPRTSIVLSSCLCGFLCGLRVDATWVSLAVIGLRTPCRCQRDRLSSLGPSARSQTSRQATLLHPPSNKKPPELLRDKHGLYAQLRHATAEAVLCRSYLRAKSPGPQPS